MAWTVERISGTDVLHHNGEFRNDFANIIVYYNIPYNILVVQRGGAMAVALDVRSRSCGCDSQPFDIHVTTVDKSFTHMCLCH